MFRAPPPPSGLPVRGRAHHHGQQRRQRRARAGRTVPRLRRARRPRRHRLAPRAYGQKKVMLYIMSHIQGGSVSTTLNETIVLTAP